MKLDALFKLFDEARKLIAHQDFVVIGSLSILGLEGDFDIPDGMTLSIAVTCYTKSDPERILDVLGALGENSPYHHQSGFYLDAVNPALPSLPDGWADRLNKVAPRAKSTEVALTRTCVQARALQPSCKK